jgi:hypothetical protein
MNSLRWVAVPTVFCLVLVFSPLHATNYYYLPQAAAGTIGDLLIMTQVSISNPTGSPSEMAVVFMANSGDPWTVSTSCLEDSALNGSFSELNFTLPANSKYAINANIASGAGVGWIGIESSQNVMVSANYGFYQKASGTAEYDPLWEAAVLPAPSAMELSFAAHVKILGKWEQWDSPDTVFGLNVTTGYAISNPNEVLALVTATLLDEHGTQKDSQTFNIPPHGHHAEFVNERFSANWNEFRGTVRLSSTVPVAALAMRESKRGTKIVYSTLPVEPDAKFKVGVDYDREPNTTLADAQIIQAPVEIFGVVCGNDGSGGSRDYYQIHLNAGQRLEVVVLAGAQGSPLHPVLSIRNSSDVDVGTVQEMFTGAYDQRGTFTAASAGDYFVRVSSIDGTDQRGAFYRLFVRVY